MRERKIERKGESLRSIKSSLSFSLSFSLPLHHSCDKLFQALSRFSVLQEQGYVGTTTSQLQRTDWLSAIFLHLVFDKAMYTKHGQRLARREVLTPGTHLEQHTLCRWADKTCLILWPALCLLHAHTSLQWNFSLWQKKTCGLNHLVLLQNMGNFITEQNYCKRFFQK